MAQDIFSILPPEIIRVIEICTQEKRYSIDAATEKKFFAAVSRLDMNIFMQFWPVFFETYLYREGVAVYTEADRHLIYLAAAIVGARAYDPSRNATTRFDQTISNNLFAELPYADGIGRLLKGMKTFYLGLPAQSILLQEFLALQAYPSKG